VPEPRRAYYGAFRDAAGEIIDLGIALYFPAPHSYTGEDVLELQGHGGPVVLQLLLQRCLDLGARPARPGEFTERAFLNNKLDLAQAEGVADLIEASTAAAARGATRSLSGAFSGAVHELVRALIELRSLVEATLDFPEEEINFLRETDAAQRLAALVDMLEQTTARAQQGSLLRSGLQVVLAGRPNVGKSSLLNRLAGQERAIVTEVPGTTRDALREAIQIEGIPLHIIDTAGLRDTADAVERLGIARSWGEIGQADVVILMTDAREGMTAEDRAIAADLPASAVPLIVANKLDLTGRAPERTEAEGRVGLFLSAKTGEGIELLRRELLRVAGWQPATEDIFLARERHLRALGQARAHLAEASSKLGQAELCAEELRLAQESLNQITGEFGADDLLGEIFSRFCIGK
jgi:tRNA modification GTPase